MENYIQCFLSKMMDDANEDSLVCTTTWIPEEFAIVGKLTKVKDNGVWSDGWKIRRIWKTKTKDWLDQHKKEVNI